MEGAPMSAHLSPPAAELEERALRELSRQFAFIAHFRLDEALAAAYRRGRLDEAAAKAPPRKIPPRINKAAIDAQEHDAIVARLRATRGDVDLVAKEFNRGRSTIVRLLPRARA